MFFKAFILPLVTVAVQVLALPARRDTFPFPAQANVSGACALAMWMRRSDNKFV